MESRIFRLEDGTVRLAPGALRRIWRLAFLIATPVAAVSVLSVYLLGLLAGQPRTAAASLLRGLPDSYLWAGLAPLVIWLGIHVRVTRRRWLASLAFHVAAGSLVVAVQLLAITLYSRLFIAESLSRQDFWLTYGFNLTQWYHAALITYFLLVTFSQAIAYSIESRDRELRATRLEARLSDARLHALRTQLRPHFLFNTLNTVTNLMRDRRRDDAIEVVTRLSSLLRSTLDESDEQRITVAHEFEFLRDYLDIEEARFADRLRTRLEIDGEARDALVPRMILQPLVENAMHHGIGGAPDAGRLEVRARRETDRLILTVTDDGPGLRAAGPPGGENGNAPGGVGLSNVRARLDALYGDAARLELEPHAPRGTRARITLPWSAGSAKAGRP